MQADLLIADSGSTKCEWALITPSGIRRVITQGISPYFMDTAQIIALLDKELLGNISDIGSIKSVFYYGTGCTAPATVSIVRNALSALFPAAQVEVDYDLVGAAHALCGTEEGIVCILGTGSNSCYYDGKEIKKNNPGLGYILGDEGSGAYLGKKVIAEYLYGKLSVRTEKLFEEMFGTDKDALLSSVYSAGLPNRYLATFSPFFAVHRGNPELERLLREGLNDFFNLHISVYRQHTTVPVHFSGSIAWAYGDVLQRLCADHKIKAGKIVKEPMSELIRYHSAADL